MKTIDFKGKPYVEVNERVKHFRANYKTGSIETVLMSNDNGICIFRAIIRVDGVLVSTGYAYEKEGSSFINKTSYIENCETSAIGRALGFLGIGIDASIASAEEVQNAVANQQNKPVTTQKQDNGSKGRIEEVLRFAGQYWDELPEGVQAYFRTLDTFNGDYPADKFKKDMDNLKDLESKINNAGDK